MPTDGVKLSGAPRKGVGPCVDTTLESPVWAPKVQGSDS